MELRAREGTFGKGFGGNEICFGKRKTSDGILGRGGNVTVAVGTSWWLSLVLDGVLDKTERSSLIQLA